MIDEAVYYLLANTSGITNLVSTRIYNAHLPQGVTFPCISFWTVSTFDRELIHGGSANVATSRFQINCFADDPKEAKTIAAAVRSLFQGYSGTVNDAEELFFCKVEDGTDLFDEDLKIYHIPVDVLISYRET